MRRASGALLMRGVGVAAAALGLSVVGLIAAVVVKWPPALGAARRLSYRYVNPRQMRTAGTPRAYAAVLHHRGRRSGTWYRTPVTVFDHDQRFVVATPYGRHADWVRNVLSAQRAIIDYDGQRHEIGQAQLVAAREVAQAFPPRLRRWMRLANITEAVVLLNPSPTPQPPFGSAHDAHADDGGGGGGGGGGEG